MFILRRVFAFRPPCGRQFQSNRFSASYRVCDRRHGLTIGAFIIWTLIAAGAVEAQNTGCSVNSSTDTATCTSGVQSGGISYEVPDVSTLNVSGNSSSVTSGTIGIELSGTGGSAVTDGSSVTTTDFYEVTVKLDADGEIDSGGTDTTVLAVDVPDGSGGTTTKYVTVTGTLSDDGVGDGPLVAVTGSGSNKSLVNADTGVELTEGQQDTIFANELSGVSSGGSGSAGTGVLLNNASAVTTVNADGVVVQSSGQNGGKGGTINILGLYAKGKDGGDGKLGGTVDVTNSGAIEVTGTSADQYGIYAHSSGGDGGRGGGAGALAARAGQGGDGGKGGEVYVTLDGGSDITTHNDGGIGVYAVSEGGRGGAGGNASGAYAEGDQGGDGGDGNTVEVVQNSAGDSIQTHGANAHGIYALSVGGGAGEGGDASGLASFGGDGGAATTGGQVTVDAKGTIATAGTESNAIYAQSIGGGGGDAGSSGAVFAAVGGTGGDGGNAGNVDISLGALGVLITKQNDSSGIVAQAIGGGGGDGGNATAVGLIANVAIGGGGARGGEGGEVDVDVLGDITTSGTDSAGIFAQSIGGRGGRGGSSTAVAVSTGVASFSVSLAGAGGSGNIGKQVDVTTGDNSDIATDGNRGVAILAQSIGGGGGQGGNSVGVAVGAGYAGTVSLGGDGGSGANGGTVNVTTGAGTITTGTASAGYDISTWGASGQTEYALVSTTVDLDTGGVAGSGATNTATKTLLSRNGTLVTLGGHYVEVSEVGANAVFTSTDPGASAALDDDMIASIYSSDGAHGILAQSVGGGGGSGGTSVSAALAISGALTVGLGGDGDGGGSGGVVDVNNASAITTFGQGSYGILAQSIGGGGGDGGTTVSGSVSAGLSAAVTVGGVGSSGGNGSTVTVDNYGNVLTYGDTSYAILAQSIGGGGGSGGNAISGAIGQGSVAVALGGSGGGGASAGSVSLLNYGSSIETRGEAANALVAQSIGGGGGAGGTAVAGSIGAGVVGVGISVGVGGQGGAGGDAGTVLLENKANGSVAAGKITTSGSNSTAMLAQSIGGGGGAGGTAVAAAVSVSKDGGVAASVAIGGLGADGGSGSSVEVNNDGEIVTAGADSYGILAQSLGGAGGAGGTSVGASLSASGTSSAAIGVSLGGEGGLGGTAGTVDVENTNTIITAGARASGIAAQSIGGNGGAGGIAVAGTLNASRGTGAAISVGLGGGGGTGASADAVTVTNSGDIATSGVDAFGIVAQSIGGDGGAGGLSVAAALSGSTQSSGAVGVSLGGSGGRGATSDKVTIDNSGTINTQGDRAAGLVAQSLGGGGGVGGAAIAGTFSISKSSGASISVGLGGNAGGGGTALARDASGDIIYDASGAFAEVVTVTNDGSIWTQGADAAGILAQAIGGQGGLGGLSVSGSLNLSGDTGGSVDVAIGGSGGAGGKAGAVTVSNDGTIAPVYILTEGARSGGIVAQSIGGQGGAGGLAVAASVAVSKDKSGAVSVGIGGAAGNGGQSGNVSVVNVGDGTIWTSGESTDATTGEAINNDAHGILAQSIGGSGGQGGIGAAGSFAVGAKQTVAIDVGVGGVGGLGGKSGEVLVDNAFNISTGGYASIGVVAQSIAGDGGTGGGAIALGFGGSQNESSGQIGVAVGGGAGSGATASTVTVLQSGNIVTEGDSAYAILAQSIGGSGGQGGFSVAAGGEYTGGSDKFGGSVNVSIGGTGGDGGTAGDVIVGSLAEALTGTYYTSGENAAGIIAQSIGGGGGAGGFAGTLSTVVSTQKTKTTAIGVAVGGFGGDGGTAKTVTVNSASDIITEGALSYGILAQSIGGKGGQGGGSVSGTLNITTSAQGNNSVNTSVAVGGFGGAGGESGDVTVTNSGNILTGAAAADVVFDYGDSGTDDLTIVDPATGEEVTITGEHLVKDTGLFAHGIVAQSISGDGGAGGFAGSILFTRGTSDQKVSNYNASISVGGLGGSGGEVKGIVSVTNALGATIEIQGERAVGILAQSIGGSGGAGGDAGLGDDFWGEEFLLDTAVVGTIRNGGDTSGLDLGAGGSLVGASGANSNSLSVAVGGVGGKGDDANSVYVDNAGQILTLGTKSHGIQAQSIGGGGGSGGLSTAASAAVQASKSRSISIGVGGVGLDGGDGKLVDVTNSGRIVTLGRGAAGVYAQSIGGGGGSGGDTVGFTLQRKDTSIESEKKELNKLKSGFQLTAVVGGMAGIGGKGGTVNVTNTETGDIETVGTLAYGVFAQSIGGGGGDGGSASVSSKEIGAFLENDKTEKKQFRTQKYKFAVGGWGGSGGVGGDVTVTNEGSIVTQGEMAVAVYAQSVGGGGGTGGKASTGLTGDIQLGGFGGIGNDGGTVVVNNTGYISTGNVLAHGIFAQSVGGGGGDGGASEFGSARSFRNDWFKAVRQKGTQEGTSKFFKEKIFAPTFGIGVGGFGGSAGDGGDVIVCNGSTWNGRSCEVDPNVDADTAAALAQIITTGVSAHGIFAQSVGGGGGTGGSTTLTNVGKIGIGGLGGAAGDGGDVFVQNDGAISTQGEGAYGIFAQSVGGGGGTAGDITFGIEGFGEDVSKIERGIDKLTDSATEAVPVDLDDDGVISEKEQLYSDLVNGIEVDPSRLGLGTGGTIDDIADDYLDFNGDGETDVASDALQIVGGKVSITEKFDLDRNGLPISDEVKAAFAGLYNAGASGSNSDAASSLLGFTGVDNYAGLSGESTDAAAQAALVNLLTSTLLNTPTDSILDGLAVAWDPTATGFDPANQDKIFGGAFASIGLENLSGEDILSIVQQLNSGEVDADGFVEITGIGPDPAISFRIPLLDGANGDGGDVTVIHNGDIYVAGGSSADLEARAGSIGIFAQSVGGGGGIVAETETFNEADVGADVNGDGDMVDDFEFSGGRAFAGTVGGQGKGGNVTVIHNGNIIAPAWNGYAIFAQSLGGDGGGNVHVELNGVIVAGLGDDENTSSTILIDGGSDGTTDYDGDGDIDADDDNNLILGGDTFLFGLGDRVVSGTFGNDRVTLQSGGQVIGNINLVTDSRGVTASSSEINTFTVESGATLRTRDIVNLGENGLLTVAGTLVVGGEVEDPDLQTWIENNPYGLTPIQAIAALNANSFHIIQNQVTTTALTGQFLMQDTTPGNSATPELFVDVRFGSASYVSDLITTTGTATVAGVIHPTLLALTKTTPPVTIIDPTDGAGAANNNGAVAKDTVVVDYSVGIDGVSKDGQVASGAKTIDLIIESVDFSIAGMTRNQTAVGDHLNTIIMGDGVGGGSGTLLAQLIAMIANKPLGSEEEVIDLMDRLTTEGYAAMRVDTLFAGKEFADALRDCEQHTADGLKPEQGQCLWADVTGRFLRKEASYQFKEIESDSYQFVGGIKFPISDTWRLGLAAGYDSVNLGLGSRFSSKGDRGHAGVEVEQVIGGLSFGAGLSGSYGAYESKRGIGIDDYVSSTDSQHLQIGTAEASHDIAEANIRIGAAYTFSLLNQAGVSWYLKPSVSLDATYIHSFDAAETGVGNVGMRLYDTGDWVYSASPMLELGGSFDMGAGTVVKPFVRGGLTVFSDDELSINSAFIGAPASAGGFTNWSDFDDLVGRVSAGFSIHNEDSVDFSFGYEGLIGDNIEQHSGKARLTIDLN